DDEIVAVWNACDQFGAFGLLVRFCLLTGWRRNEGATIAWSNGANISLGDRITFAAGMTQMGEPHVVPRTGLRDEVLEAAAKLKRPSSDYVSPSRHQKAVPISGISTMLDSLVKAAGIERFTMHDLRRTTRSTMGQLGISNETQRRCVGQQAGTTL